MTQTTYTPKTKKVHETPHYIIILDKIIGLYELYKKDTGEADPVATCNYSVPLIVAANALEKAV